MRRRASRRGVVVAVAVATLLAVGCGRGETGEATSAPHAELSRRVENPELQLALADVPAGLEVAANEGAEIHLRPVAQGLDGLLVVAEDEPRTNPNMVAAIEEHQATIESRPDGVYGGQRELTYSFGSAFYSRGQFTENGRPMEETILVTLHPAKGDRLLRMTYTYPVAADTAERLGEHLFVLLGELEVLAAAAPAAGEPAADAAP